MARTTTARNACDVRIYMDDSAGALTELTGSATRLEPSGTVNVGDFRTFNEAAPGRLACGKDMSWTLTGVFSDTADETYDLLIDWFTGPLYATARTLRYEVADNAGKRWEAEVLMTDWNAPLDPSTPGPILITATLVPDGDVVHSTIGS